MKKSEFINRVSKSIDLSKAKTEIIVNTFLEEIMLSLEKGRKITLKGFGTFQVKERKEKSGINPLTSKKIIIPATKYPSFKASSSLKNRIRTNK